ncbi:MAG: roadblock/LC7 domain-containing protein [Chloroflexi bacterium]|jgi:predicted regulator of Ras-like GTPase activity (Roadblock/LC7/MglB family)|nr:roadblock/LC7 domain-containing protein [Chloroflexota bacterium]
MTDRLQTRHQPANPIDRALEDGIRAAQAGKKSLARQLLLKVTELDPFREDAWLWLSWVAESPEEAMTYLQTVLALNPNNRRAQEGLRWLQSRYSSSLEMKIRAEDEPSPVADAPVATPETEREASPDLTGPGEQAPFILSVEQAEAIDRCMDRIAENSGARCIILADVTGRLIAERGQTQGMNTQVLSALAAGELVATHELARLVGERARFKMLLNEGESQNVYLSDVGEQLILIIVFDTETPIGIVRLVLKRAVEELTPILMQSSPTSTETPINEALDDDFAQLLENELDVSFQA